MASPSTAVPVTLTSSGSLDTAMRIVGDVRFESDVGSASAAGSFQTFTLGSLQRMVNAPEPIRLVPDARTANVLLQLWEGTVVGVGQGEFTAVVRDKTNTTNPDEEVVISFEELGDEDRPLVRIGAIFYWSIRYEQEPGLPRRRVTRIRFRRLPAWSKSEVQRVDDFAQRARSLWASNAADRSEG